MAVEPSPAAGACEYEGQYHLGGKEYGYLTSGSIEQKSIVCGVLHNDFLCM